LFWGLPPDDFQKEWAPEEETDEMTNDQRRCKPGGLTVEHFEGFMAMEMA
jgi:hypothetical protein